ASQLVQTNTLLDSQTTNTHPSPQPTQGHVHWGASASNIATPQPDPNPGRTRVRPGQTRQKPCSSNHVPGGATRYNSRPDQKRRANPNPTPPPREPHHMTTARIAEQLYSSPSVPVLPPISPSRRVDEQLKASPSAVLPFEHDQALCCRAFLGASLPCADRRRRRRIRVHRPEPA